MRLELKKKRDVPKVDTYGNKYVHTIRKYRSVAEMESDLNSALEAIGIIRELMEGISLQVFRDNRAILDRCAINMQVIGNVVGALDEPLQFNDSMKSINKIRAVIAHVYGTEKFDSDLLWDNLNAGLDNLEAGCNRALEVIRNPDTEIIFTDNRKKRLIKN